ncbi:MAG: GntR family transcriptional regulator [Proteobacteria bacterium]|nr:GntR family transcriptional regulator [Pseudomonadota bacterium]
MSLAEQGAAALRKLILRTTLAPGSVVTEREICALLGISRTPAREAIRTLINEGLIDSSDTGRHSIANPNIETVVNLVQVLGALEGLAAELAAENATDAELRQTAQFHEKMGTMVGDESDFKYFDTNIAFHRAIVAASRNPKLALLHKSIDDQLYLARYRSSRKQQRREAAVGEHGKVVDALVARDGQAARNAMIGHLSTTIRNLREADAEAAGR